MKQVLETMLCAIVVLLGAHGADAESYVETSLGADARYEFRHPGGVLNHPTIGGERSGIAVEATPVRHLWADGALHEALSGAGGSLEGELSIADGRGTRLIHAGLSYGWDAYQPDGVLNHPTIDKGTSGVAALDAVAFVYGGDYSRLKAHSGGGTELLSTDTHVAHKWGTGFDLPELLGAQRAGL